MWSSTRWQLMHHICDWIEYNIQRLHVWIGCLSIPANTLVAHPTLYNIQTSTIFLYFVTNRNWWFCYDMRPLDRLVGPGSNGYSSLSFSVFVWIQGNLTLVIKYVLQSNELHQPKFDEQNQMHFRLMQTASVFLQFCHVILETREMLFYELWGNWAFLCS